MYRQIYFNKLLPYTEKRKVVITEQLEENTLQSFGGCPVDKGKEFRGLKYTHHRKRNCIIKKHQPSYLLVMATKNTDWCRWEDILQVLIA